MGFLGQLKICSGRVFPTSDIKIMSHVDGFFRLLKHISVFSIVDIIILKKAKDKCNILTL